MQRPLDSVPYQSVGVFHINLLRLIREPSGDKERQRIIYRGIYLLSMPSKYKRRIIKLGDSEVVTLPKEWRDYQDFKDDLEGDGKDVEMLANRVLIIYKKGDKKAAENARKMMEEHG